MSEYKGPAFKSKDQQPVSQRRFNRLNQQNLFQKSDRSTSRISINEWNHYELPKKTKSLSIKNELSKPVDSSELNKHLERVKNNETNTMSLEYEVPFLKQKKEQISVWEQKKNSDVVIKKEFFLKDTKQTSSYQPAYSPKVISDSKEEMSLGHQQIKSIEDGNVRIIATRLIKDKASYLLFEENKEIN